MKAFKEATQAEKLRFETEERRTHAIEKLLSKWAEPSKTATPAQQDVNDDGMWGKLLVNRVKTIKGQEVKEDFKQHLNVLALQAARGTWRLSPVKSYAASPMLGTARPAFMQQSPRLLKAIHRRVGFHTGASLVQRETPKCPLSIWPVPCRRRWQDKCLQLCPQCPRLCRCKRQCKRLCKPSYQDRFNP